MSLKIIFGWEGKRANFPHVLCQGVIQTGRIPVGNPHGRPLIASKKQISAFLWRRANQEFRRGMSGRSIFDDLMMECQMEQKISGISKFSEERTTSRGWPEFSKQSFRNSPFHLILYRNFRKFWLNGSRPGCADLRKQWPEPGSVTSGFQWKHGRYFMWQSAKTATHARWKWWSLKFKMADSESHFWAILKKIALSRTEFWTVYLCFYVCMYVCMYVCIFLCMGYVTPMRLKLLYWPIIHQWNCPI